MIDRSARNEVIAAFGAYLDDKITAFEFDDRLQDIDSEDRTVNEIIHAAWFHYDECKDHKVHLSKPEWDYFQRLLLILRSDAEISSSEKRRWSWDHALAWMALATFIALAMIAGWGWHLFLHAIPFGIISVLISVYRRRREPAPQSDKIACMPFDSFSQIRQFRQHLPEFVKRPYRREIGQRTIRGKAEESFNWAFSYCYWILCGPVVLLFQGFPSSVDHTLKLTKP
jgi:hypothetical protein